MKILDSICQTFGLHPSVGFSLFAVDTMLFASEVLTVEATWALTVPIGLALIVPAALLQKRLYGDSWKAAVGKGLLVGLLTAIPLPLASIMTFAGGLIGTGKAMLGGGKSEERLLAER
ncbi:MAG TPA: hypothetical protein VFA21_08855 [Pyrinomonadaceae bacterium]|nr:hypothetical protein [Pyrinomonadaceae bacterium]